MSWLRISFPDTRKQTFIKMDKVHRTQTQRLYISYILLHNKLHPNLVAQHSLYISKFLWVRILAWWFWLKDSQELAAQILVEDAVIWRGVWNQRIHVQAHSASRQHKASFSSLAAADWTHLFLPLRLLLTRQLSSCRANDLRKKYQSRSCNVFCNNLSNGMLSFWHTLMWKETTQGYEYQKVGIIWSHLEGWLPQSGLYGSPSSHMQNTLIPPYIRFILLPKCHPMTGTT